MTRSTISRKEKRSNRGTNSVESIGREIAVTRSSLHFLLVGTLIFTSFFLSPVTAFVQQSPVGIGSTSNSERITIPSFPKSTEFGTQRTPKTGSFLLAKVPRIDEWEVMKSGAIKGTLSDHPTLPDGFEITTSPLDERSVLKANSLVTTASGSKYRLLKPLPPKEDKKKKKQGQKKTVQKQPQKKEPRATKSMFGSASKEVKTPASKKVTKPKTKSAAKAKPDIDLNGKAVSTGKDKYLLVGKLIRSSSTRSQIYYAYKADKNDEPTGPRLTVKLTQSIGRLSRENKNYNRVFSKGRVLFAPLEGSGSCYVKKVGYCAGVDQFSGTSGIPKGCSALILESGELNLRAYFAETRQGLSGSALRKACVSVCRCVEAMHSSGLVWTDLKAENFVMMPASGGKMEVKGIDLESAVLVKGSPEDYSPEASPPEFAVAEKRNKGYEFQVLKNYDSWSLGMLFYELATGRNYFRGKSEGAILNELASENIVDGKSIAGLDAIEDDNFRDLVKQCLSIDPKKRPSIGFILLHPYFLTTGLGPLTF